jgi:hypothetical protein
VCISQATSDDGLDSLDVFEQLSMVDPIKLAQEGVDLQIKTIYYDHLDSCPTSKAIFTFVIQTAKLK